MVEPSHLRTCRCPACGAAESTGGVKSCPAAEEVDYKLIKSGWMGFFKEKIFFTYERCNSCGLLYAPVYLTDEALSELYGGMSDNTAGLSKDYLTKTQKGYFDFFKRHGSFDGDYFELGPDVGLFTKFVAAEPSIGKLWLYEPNRNVAEALAERVRGANFEIRTEMMDFSAVPDESLSTCVLIHVLDHLPNVREVMTKLYKKLKPGGYLLVVTHDERSFCARIFRSRWPAYCMQHPLLFNVRSTAMFLDSVGIKVIETRKSVNYFPVTYLAKHLLYACGIKQIADWNFRAVIIPAKLGNIITVARKC